MLPESRIDIYNYVYGLLFGVVSDNVYSMDEPQELTESDTTDGFIVIRLQDIYDESEFLGEAYGWVRVFVEAYIPPISRGRLNKAKYKSFEEGITQAINDEIENGTNEFYSIESDGILSMDSNADTNANNAYFMYVKSFIVNIDNPVEVPPPVEVGDLYIGLAGDNIASVEDLESVQHYSTNNPRGNYSIVFPSTRYLWICSTQPISNITSSGFDVPYEEIEAIEDLHCYRSANDIIEGTMNFTIE